MQPAVFLDRDDTLIEANALPAPGPPAARGDVVSPGSVRLLPGVRGACARLVNGGFVLVVITNQGAVARGALGPVGVERVNERVRELLDPVRLGAVYFCPFHPRGSVPAFTAEHPWRKPAGGMILAAAGELGLDLGRSWFVGDAARDVEAGIAAGVPASRCLRIGPDQPWRDLAGAADAILSSTDAQVSAETRDVR